MDKDDYDQRMINSINEGPYVEMNDGRWKDGKPLQNMENDVKKCLKDLVMNCGLQSRTM